MKFNFFIIVLCFFSFRLNAQTNFSGTWAGTLNIAGQLRLVVHINQAADGTYSGELDSPDQNASGIKFDTVEIKADIAGNKTFEFSISKYKIQYTGKLVNDSTVSGTFTQGVAIPLELKRMNASYVAQPIVRPQTPKPPFPYNAENVSYNSNGLQYGG